MLTVYLLKHPPENQLCNWIRSNEKTVFRLKLNVSLKFTYQSFAYIVLDLRFKNLVYYL